MDKRILGFIITILILLGVFWVFAGAGTSTTNTVDATTVAGNDTVRSTSYSSPGDTTLLNFTINPNFVGGSRSYNITNVTIKEPAGNYYRIMGIVNTSYVKNKLRCITLSTGLGVQCMCINLSTSSNVSGNRSFSVMLNVDFNWTAGVVNDEGLKNWEVIVLTNATKAIGSSASITASTDVANKSGSRTIVQFGIDDLAPVVGITMPSVTTIYSNRDVKIRCGASDSTPSKEAEITIVQPDGREYSRFVDSNTHEATFSSKETGPAGVYKVKCKLADIYGHETEITKDGDNDYSFRVLYRAGGGGAAAEEPVAKVDISTTASPSKEISGIQGESESFTLDGTIQHRITFVEIGKDYAKMTIESEPIELTLKVGESKSVDLDSDGTDDVKVTLSSIVDGKASVSVTNIEKYEEKLEEERVAREGPAEEKGWGLWIALIVILALIVIGYFVLKSKSKKGVLHFSRQDLGL